jgi:hypothetical protein
MTSTKNEEKILALEEQAFFVERQAFDGQLPFGATYNSHLGTCNCSFRRTDNHSTVNQSL